MVPSQNAHKQQHHWIRFVFGKIPVRKIASTNSIEQSTQALGGGPNCKIKNWSLIQPGRRFDLRSYVNRLFGSVL